MARFRARWSRLSRLSRAMLVLALLASAAVTVILGFVVYLFIGGYSGGSSPTNVAPVLFPVAILLFLVAGLPSMLLCGVMWAGYSLSRHRGRRDGAPDGRPGSGT